MLIVQELVCYKKGIGGRLAMMAKLKCGSRMFAGPADCSSSFQLRDDFHAFEFADNARGVDSAFSLAIC